MAKKPTKPKTGEVIVRSVRANGRSIACKWEQNGDAYDVTFHDNPLPSFDKALAALAAHVASLCELPAKEADKITPTGITLRPLGDDNAMALITAGKKIRKGKRVFNMSTPLLSMYPAGGDDAKAGDAMDADEAKAIEKFASEAKKYICGERAQGKLALGEEETEEEKNQPDNQETFPALTDEPKK